MGKNDPKTQPQEEMRTDWGMTALVGIVALGIGFWGGMTYQQNQTTEVVEITPVVESTPTPSPEASDLPEFENIEESAMDDVMMESTQSAE